MSPQENPSQLVPIRRRRVAGFSLIEVLLAAAVIVVGCTAVFAALTRVHRHAIINRAHTNAYNILRNVMDQAMQRGWEDRDNPRDHLKPTVAGWTSAYVPNPGEAGSGVARNTTVASNTNWKRWDMYSAQDTTFDVSLPVYQDIQNPEKNVEARLYRKVQYVQNDKNLLWVTFRLEYLIRGQLYAHNLCSLRAID